MTVGKIIEAEEDIRQIIRSTKTIAVVGMRDEAHMETPAYSIPRILKELGYEIVPVSPKIRSS
jgi:predicted CoA-binding protein